ncbi:MAG TPA: hypothetical protein VFH39_01230 [Candidatus Saccharimonadales bacterium]|nr:hypothetical protein [Candidatus Saccharimonadales bacterium]
MYESDPWQLTDAVSAQLDIPLDKSTLYAREDGHIAGTSIGGEHDVHMRRLDWAEAVSATPFGTFRLTEKFHWNGLLRHQRGGIRLELPDTASHTRQAICLAEVISAPAGINAAQRLLGREPGSDAFMLKRYKGKAKYTSGEWVEGFAQQVVPIADLSNPDYALHDTYPTDHVQSWINTPPEICRVIAERAAHLQAKYGDRIHAEHNRPRSVNDFVNAVDLLSNFTRVLFQRTMNTVDIVRPGQLIEKFERVASDNPLSYAQLRRRYCWPKGDDWYDDEGITTLMHLGLLRPAFSRSENLQRFNAVRSTFIAHIARMCITAEEVAPNAEFSPVERAFTLDEWHAVAQHFGDAKISV